MRQIARGSENHEVEVLDRVEIPDEAMDGIIEDEGDDREDQSPDKSRYKPRTTVVWGLTTKTLHHRKCLYQDFEARAVADYEVIHIRGQRT